MLNAVAETDAYISKAEKIMTAVKMDAVVDMIAANPLMGDLIQGTHGLRKIRIPLQRRGKRGGGRVIYWFYNEDYPAVLLWALAKNAASDLTAAQQKALVILTKDFLEHFRSET